MDPIEITYRLRRAGYTQTRLADELGVRPVSVHTVISGRVKSHRIRTAIADTIGLRVEDIWPDQTPVGTLD